MLDAEIEKAIDEWCVRDNGDIDKLHAVIQRVAREFADAAVRRVLADVVPIMSTMDYGKIIREALAAAERDE